MDLNLNVTDDLFLILATVSKTEGDLSRWWQSQGCDYRTGKNQTSRPRVHDSRDHGPANSLGGQDAELGCHDILVIGHFEVHGKATHLWTPAAFVKGGGIHRI